ncbi:hypothetical protein P692DRAFT_20880534 [Suillus brevipes Sb2]|nr:hypothetical protein P692DRAFT_20880534 [Suillus brevipes Sb2]
MLEERGALPIADAIITSFKVRQNNLKAAEYNDRLTKGGIGPGLKGLWWFIRCVRAEHEKQWREKDSGSARQVSSWWFWSTGILKVIGDHKDIQHPPINVVKMLAPFPVYLKSPAHPSSTMTTPLDDNTGQHR